MKVILFGATGMVGQGVLRECLSDDDIAVGPQGNIYVADRENGRLQWFDR